TCGLVTAQAADTTLMLACKGTRTFSMHGGTTKTEMTEPISMGIIVNLTARTVTGLEERPLTIQSVNEVTIAFFWSKNDVTVSGTIDRLTGDMAATTATAAAIWRYSLKCTPTQRMF